MPQTVRVEVIGEVLEVLNSTVPCMRVLLRQSPYSFGSFCGRIAVSIANVEVGVPLEMGWADDFRKLFVEDEMIINDIVKSTL
jgi:hypothetical protein